MSDCSKKSNVLGRVAGRVFRRVKRVGPESPERRTGRIVWGDSTLQTLCEWKTQQGPIQVDAVYWVMCDPRLQYCIYQLTMNQIRRCWICCIKGNLNYRGKH